jgi:hypothetical protein
VGIVPIRLEHNEYAKKVANKLAANRIRFEADYSDKNMKEKIKYYKNFKTPYVVIIGDKVPNDSIILYGDFEVKPYGKRFLGNWKKGQWYGNKVLIVDNKTFRTAGASAVLTPGEGLTYFPKLKPNTKYLFSFSVKLENVKAQERNASGFYSYVRTGGPGPAKQYFSMPTSAMTGSNDWVRMEMEFTTAAKIGTREKPYLGFTLRKATGKAWVDNVRLVEVK